MAVLIPSSSGLRLECLTTPGSVVMPRLNPFFIRSAVGINGEGRSGPPRWVLIPSSSGLRLECNTAGGVITAIRLNPFFIRSAVGINRAQQMGVLVQS